MDKQLQLARAKRHALWWLCGAALLFICLSVVQTYQPGLQGSFWVGLIKMAAEAALIGGLADWFAVTALFKPIPARYPIPHTNIVASNKQAIADNLANFVREKFFNPAAIEALISSSQPAVGAGRWLQQPANAQRLARYLCDTFTGFIHIIDDAPVQKFILQAIKRGINKVELGPLAAGTLTVLTRKGRHQKVLDGVLHKLATMAQTDATQALIAEKLNQWLKTEHRRLEKLLPSQWLSEQGAQVAVSAMAGILADIDNDPDHPLRRAFDEQLQHFIAQLESDPAYLHKLEELRTGLLENETLHTYVGKIWQDVHGWLVADLAKPDGRSQQAVAGALQEIGTAILNDDALAAALDKHIAEAGRYMAPELADFLTGHIRTTINSWDEDDMAAQIELNIGKDLQKVRINGTLVGGLIGALLFIIERGIGWLGKGVVG
ncbi:DUF445 family protein [Alteromonas sp. ASW11-19]|uniref:DUF445 family protein n=1 Tax=Alteromonas salexigens TaxID=2982530 RepID=A0ABT2VPQ7_9ALTE|nr:DUF445 family protein [Alteromonas salexigens]MCU7555306.1 DUF445 family protein [Alteromonas salexigens]